MSASQSLVGVKLWSGDGAGACPQHGVVIGPSASGKSVLVFDLLTQSAVDCAFTGIVDYGLSHEVYTRTVDANARPIIIRPNGTVTINYLDTHQLPLTPDHLANATALVSLMVGRSKDEDKECHRRAVISKYISQLYTDVFEEWARCHPDAAMDTAREACALEQFSACHPDDGLIECFVRFRDWQREKADEASQFLQQFSEQEVLKFLKNPASREKVRNLAFARFRPDQYPTHQMLQELMQLDAAAGDQDEAGHIAMQLLPWCRGGNYGALFDGISNVSLNGSIVHFELGQIPESARALRSAAAFLVVAFIRQHIFTLPRSAKKRMVFEEASAFLTVPGAEQILSQAYEQARKFNVWLLAVFQQYARLAESPVRAAVMGNSRQFFIFRLDDPQDLEALASDLGLSRSAVDAIRSYGPPGASGSQFTYFHRDYPHPICGTVRHLASREMLYAAASGGAHFEQRRKELAGAGSNLVQRIIELANAQSPT